jgi:hypothetical protein
MSTTPGNNKAACKLYKDRGRLEANKKRNALRHLKAVIKKGDKLRKRLHTGKPLATRITARVNGTSRGKMPNGQHTKELCPVKQARPIFNHHSGEWVAL